MACGVTMVLCHQTLARIWQSKPVRPKKESNLRYGLRGALRNRLSALPLLNLHVSFKVYGSGFGVYFGLQG
jgi:hypothetical protein